MGTREQILEAVRTSKRELVQLPEIPNFAEDPQGLSEKFESALKRLAGVVVHNPPKDFERFLRETFPAAKTICSTARKCKETCAWRTSAVGQTPVKSMSRSFAPR